MANDVIIAEVTQDPATGNVHITAVLGGARQDIAIQYAAIAHRKTRYGLATDAEAIEAIIKEHVTRLLNLGADKQDDPRIAAAGGLRQDVAIKAGTLADLPPVPKAAPTAKEVFETELTAATTLDGVKAALSKWAASR